MAKDARFWRNVTLIGLAHAVILVGLIRWSRETKSSNRQTIVWMNGGAGDGVAKTRSAAAPKLVKTSTPPPEPRPSKTKEAEEEQLVLTSAKSNIQTNLKRTTNKPMRMRKRRRSQKLRWRRMTRATAIHRKNR